MTIPTHLATTYLAYPIITKIPSYGQLIQPKRKLLFVYCLMLSVLIDIDAFIFGVPNHHRSLLHYPFIWISTFSVLYLFGRYKHSSFIQIFALATLFTALLHLFQDLFGRTIGILLFWPLSAQEFSITPLAPQYQST